MQKLKSPEEDEFRVRVLILYKSPGNPERDDDDIPSSHVYGPHGRSLFLFIQ